MIDFVLGDLDLDLSGDFPSEFEREDFVSEDLDLDLIWDFVLEDLDLDLAGDFSSELERDPGDFGLRSLGVDFALELVSSSSLEER